MARAGAWGVGLLVGALVLSASARNLEPRSGLEVVATGLARPLQLAVDGDSLLVLGLDSRGDAAGELYRIDLTGPLPVDLARQPRIQIPFPDAWTATLGSLVVAPSSRELFLGEENGGRIWRLGADNRLTLYATGLRRLMGGSTLAFDQGGRLLIVDHADPRLSPSDEAHVPGLEQFRDEDYRGPLLFRLDLDPGIRLPREVGRLAPLFPRGWNGPAGGGFLPRLVAVATRGRDLVVLSSSGELFTIDGRGALVPLAKLSAGQYHRVNMVAASDGMVYVSGGFWVARVFSISPAGSVTTIATDVADPQGIALDARGNVYVVESSLHRILRIRQQAP
jgi:sugar lactone lactonase YvrE